MLFIGGRMLAPAAAGEFYRQGMELGARVQPNIEASLIITIAAAYLLAPVAVPFSGMLLILCGVLAGIRLFRWQLWHCLARPDLICLGLGYGWLALGLILLGWQNWMAAVISALQYMPLPSGHWVPWRPTSSCG